MRYLFERLSGESRPDTKRAVLEQLQRILVPSPGGDHTVEPNILDFGLPAVVEPELATSEGMTRLARRVERLVRHYEPRLSEVRAEVSRTRDPLAPYHITLYGRLVGDDDEIRLPIDLAGR